MCLVLSPCLTSIRPLSPNPIALTALLPQVAPKELQVLNRVSLPHEIPPDRRGGKRLKVRQKRRGGTAHQRTVDREEGLVGGEDCRVEGLGTTKNTRTKGGEELAKKGGGIQTWLLTNAEALNSAARDIFGLVCVATELGLVAITLGLAQLQTILFWPSKYLLCEVKI